MVAWFSTCVWLAGLALGVFVILLFPDGRLPSRRWRIVAWAAIFGAALDVIGFGFMPEYLILTHPYVENPFGIIGVIGGGFTTYELFGAARLCVAAPRYGSAAARLGTDDGYYDQKVRGLPVRTSHSAFSISNTVSFSASSSQRIRSKKTIFLL